MPVFPGTLIPGAKVSVGFPPPSSSLNLNSDDWESFQFQVHDIASLYTKCHYVESPIFYCNGHQWQLTVYPGGGNEANEDYLSMYLHMLPRDSGAATGSITTNYQFVIIDRFGKNRKSLKASNVFSAEGNHSWGWHDFIRRSEIVSFNDDRLMGNDCSLTIVVSIEGDQSAVFVPPNSGSQKMMAMFNDEATADVCFELVSTNTNIGHTKFWSSIHAHRNILSKFAPMLADLVGTSNKYTITDVEPPIFCHLLYYIYGGDYGGGVESEELKKYAKDIINAADKYAIVNLKLAAEAAYVESTDITIDTAIDELLYADGKNCALLKEKVMKFLADHPKEAYEKLSFEKFPQCIVKDLFFAFGRKDKDKNESSGNEDDLSTLDVSALRRKLHEMGLEVDGSREAMIESLNNSTLATSGDQSGINGTDYLAPARGGAREELHA